MTSAAFVEKWLYVSMDNAAVIGKLQHEMAADLAALLAEREREVREECAKVAEACEYRCDCGEAYRDCDAHAHIAAAIRYAGRPK